MTQLLQEREDWMEFRNLATLTRKAGVPRDDLPKLVVKELVDNGLDNNAVCCFGRLAGGVFVHDTGPGIAGTDEEIANLFSVRRPMLSSKVIRLPNRGALGNGLRVVVGA